MFVYQIGNIINIWRIDKPMFEFTIVMIVDSQNMTWKSNLLKNVSEKKVERYKKIILFRSLIKQDYPLNLSI